MSVMNLTPPTLTSRPHRYSRNVARTRRLAFKADVRAVQRADRRMASRLVKALSSIAEQQEADDRAWLDIETPAMNGGGEDARLSVSA